MAKKTIVDIKKTSNSIPPDANYVRLKTNPDNSLQVIYSDGRTRTITHAWELPIENKVIDDPSTITPNSWDRYIIPTSPVPVGDWSGHEEEIATWNNIDSIWEFTIAEQGWGAYNKAENQVYTFNGAIWTKLNASVTIIDVTHAELRLLIRSSSLIPGNTYRITDYQSYNEIIDNTNIIHTSSPSMILVEAISNNQLKASATDLDNVNDVIIYDPSITVDGWFYVIVDRVNGSIQDDDYSFDDDYIWNWSLGSHFEVNFLSDTELSLGLDTIIDLNSTIIIGDNGANTGISISDPNVNWDSSTGILTLSGGYTFISNANDYYINIHARFACAEFMKGRVIQRHDLVNNIDCDFDWRNHQYGLYSASIDFYNGGTPFYCSPSAYPITVQEPRLDFSFGNTSRDVLINIDTNDYALFPAFQSIAGYHTNIKIRTSKYTVFSGGIINGLEVENAEGMYFSEHTIYNSKIVSASRVIALPSGNMVDSSTSRLTSAILASYIKESNLSVDRCLLGRITTCDLTLRHIIMNDTSKMTSISGSISTVEMNDSTTLSNSDLGINNVILQNATAITNSTMVATRAMFDNFQLTDSKITVSSGGLIRYVYFENKNIKELIWHGYMEGTTGVGGQVYFPLVDTSDIKGEMVEEVFPGMEIHSNTITHNLGYTIPPLNLKLDVDVSSNSVSLELPPEPYNGLDYVITDITGNAIINNIIVNISSAPIGGIVNTINGGTSKTIDVNYGVLVIKYSDVGGWVIVQESVVQVDPTAVDEMTIEYIPSLGDLADTSTSSELYDNTWYTGPALAHGQTGISSSCSINEGTEYARSGLLLYCYSNPVWPLPAVDNTPILPSGDYYVYTSVDLTAYGFRLREDNRYAGYREIFAIVEKVNGIYRNRFHITVGDFRFNRLDCTIVPPTSFFARIVKAGGYPTSDVMISNVNINNIVGGDGFTFGSLTKKADDPNHETPTRAYVDNTKNNVDDITLESNLDVNNIITSTENDINELFLDAFGHGINNVAWSFKGAIAATATLVNGIISPNLADDGFGFCEEYTSEFVGTNDNSSLPNYETWNLYIYSNYRHPTHNSGIWMILDGYQPAAEIINLPNGNYLHRYIIFQGTANIFKGFRLSVPASTVPIADQPWFRMVSFNNYPPKNIIKIKEVDQIIKADGLSNDGTNTPSVDPERSLVTQSYVDKSVKADEITIENKTGFSNIVVGTSLANTISEAWFNGITGPFDNGIYDPNSGTLSALSGVDYIIEGWFETVPMPDGTYELYANKNIDAYGLQLGTSAGSHNFGLGVYENGLWKYSVTLVGAGHFNLLVNSTEDTIPATIWFIDRYNASLENKLTIKNIDWIIGRNGLSIDGSLTPSTDKDRAIPTQGFIEARVPTSDNITLQDINSEPVRSTVADFNFILNDAVDANIPTSGWGINQEDGSPAGTRPVSYLNGVFTLAAGNITWGDEFYLLDNNEVTYTPCSGSYFRLYTNIDFDSNGLELMLDDRSIAGSSRSVHHEQIQIFNGMYELTVFVAPGYQINQVYFRKANAGTVLFPEATFEFIITDQYPSNKVSKINNIDFIIGSNNQSIDSTSTPMGDAHKEINTRAYTDLNKLAKKPLRLIETINNISLTGVQTLDGVNTGNNERVGVMNQTIPSETGFYITSTSGAWTRTDDLPIDFEASGVTFGVLEGISNTDTTWIINNNITNSIVGTDGLTVVQTYSSANTQWQFSGTDRLTPTNSNVEGIEFENNQNAYTWLTLRNTENTGNSAGSVIELHKSNTAYQDNVYFGLYGDAFWIPFLAGNGALITDQNLVLGTVNNTKEVRVIVGNSYANPIEAVKINTNGLSLDSLKTLSVNPANFSNVMVDTDTGLLYANSDIMSGENKQTDTFTLTALDITNGYITLSETINTSKHEMVNYNGNMLFEGAIEDYTIDTVNNRVVFTVSQITNLYVGAKFQVKYYY